MSSFTGSIYDADGKSFDPSIPDLLQEQLDDYPHRSMVTDREEAPVARIWVLANNATPDAIPPIIMGEAVRLVLTGRAILIMAQRPEPEVNVRTALLHALDLFTAPQETAGHA